MPSDINESAKSKHDTWGVYYRIVLFGWAVLCCLVNCYVLAAPLPLFLPLFAFGLDTRSRKRCSNNMASTSKRVARKDRNSIRSHQHLCAVMLLSGCLAVCGYLCRRLCVTASLLRVGFPWTVCLGCVTQWYKQHQCILQGFPWCCSPEATRWVWLGFQDFLMQLLVVAKGLPRAEYPKIKAFKKTQTGRCWDEW